MLSLFVSFKGLFDAFKVEIDVTGEQLIANLFSQVDGFKLWQSEIEKSQVGQSMMGF